MTAKPASATAPLNSGPIHRACWDNPRTSFFTAVAIPPLKMWPSMSSGNPRRYCISREAGMTWRRLAQMASPRRGLKRCKNCLLCRRCPTLTWCVNSNAHKPIRRRRHPRWRPSCTRSFLTNMSITPTPMLWSRFRTRKAAKTRFEGCMATKS